MSEYTRPTDEALLDETTNLKIAVLSETPGLPVEFDPEEADRAGAFLEDALSLEDAQNAAQDTLI